MKKVDSNENIIKKKKKKLKWNLLSGILSKKQQILFWTVVVIFLLFCIFLIIRFTTSRSEQQIIATPVRVLLPRQGTLVKELKLSGHIESKTMVTILPLASGVLENLYVETGDYVKKGEIIAKINSQAYELQLSQAQSAYSMAKTTYDRLTKLVQVNAASRQDLDGARAQYDAYKSQYELAKLQVSYTKVEAPLSGIVLMSHLSVGDLAAPERPLVTIGDLKSLVVKANIPESYYETFLELADEMKVIIRRSEFDQGFEASISQVSPFISAESRNFQVVCNISGNPSFLRPGMSIYLDFILAEKPDIYYLPYDVLVGNDSIWVLNSTKVETLLRGVTSEVLAEEVKEEYIDTTSSIRELYEKMLIDTGSRFLFNEQKISVHQIQFSRSFQNDDFFEIPSEYADVLFLTEGQHMVVENQQVKVLK